VIVARLDLPQVPFSDAAMATTLKRLRQEWSECQDVRSRDAIYGYLEAVFEVGAWWTQDGKAEIYARRALATSDQSIQAKSEDVFGVLILCTADGEVADYRTRSKWSRVLRYALEVKNWREPPATFIKRKGGINECAKRFTRRLGRGRKGSGSKLLPSVRKVTGDE
jgi:hypothetical protein